MESDIVRGFSALGICFAWLELILLIGRYPFKGGDFSIMFYRIIKRLFRYILAQIGRNCSRNLNSGL